MAAAAKAAAPPIRARKSARRPKHTARQGGENYGRVTLSEPSLGRNLPAS